MAYDQRAPSRGELDRVDETPVLSRALTIQDYRKNSNRRFMSVGLADRFRWEVMQQGNWRRDQQLDEDYYDGNQLSSDAMADLEDRGIPPVVTNLIGPTIDVVLGMEVKSRRDFIVRPEDDPQWDDVASAIGTKLKTAERLSRADHACSEAYKRQVKGGLGWVLVRRQTDPSKFRYAAEHVDWKEIDWDPHSQDTALDDARFLRRSRFHDRDHLEAIFPAKAPLIHELGPGFRDGGSAWTDSRELFEAPMLTGGSHGPWRDLSVTELDFIDWDRNRLKLEEWWYRVWVTGQVLDLPDGSSVVYDDRHEIHVYALENGRASLRLAAWPEMRLAYYIGPLCVADVPSPYPHKHFPYVPFWGMREGRTGVPYGLIRRMRPMQDEVNARSSKMLWALSARRVIVDAGAVLDHEQVRLEVARPDAYIVLNPKRKPEDRFEVDDNAGISREQFMVMQDRIQRLQDVAGVYQATLGKKEAGVDSGVAIANLVEQGATTLAPINESFSFSRTQVGERLMALVIADMAPRRSVPVQVNSARGKRVIVLNKPTMHEQSGLEIIENHIAKARLNVTLDDVPATATFRQQQFLRIADMLGNMAKFNPELASKFLDLLVEASDVPNKAEFVDRIRDMIGLAKDPSTMSDEERAAAEQRQAEEAIQKQMMMRGAVAKMAVDESKAAEAQARAHKTEVEMQSIFSQIKNTLAQIVLTQAKTEETAAKTAAILQDIAAQQTALAANGGKPDKQEAIYRW